MWPSVQTFQHRHCVLCAAYESFVHFLKKELAADKQLQLSFLLRLEASSSDVCSGSASWTQRSGVDVSHGEGQSVPGKLGFHYPCDGSTLLERLCSSVCLACTSSLSSHEVVARLTPALVRLRAFAAPFWAPRHLLAPIRKLVKIRECWSWNKFLESENRHWSLRKISRNWHRLQRCCSH